ncbi:hypothetical protein [Chroococcidiopsis sp.]|uniref:hypothetical protein n=1 Tax=Chroococcidiopsis sp. TaxID=3088168 RepID=UPI003F31ACF5
MNADNYTQLQQIAGQIAQATLTQQKVAQQLLTVTTLQSQAIIELIETVEKLVAQTQKSRTEL